MDYEYRINKALGSAILLAESISGFSFSWSEEGFILLVRRLFQEDATLFFDEHAKMISDGKTAIKLGKFVKAALLGGSVSAADIKAGAEALLVACQAVSGKLPAGYFLELREDIVDCYCSFGKKEEKVSSCMAGERSHLMKALEGIAKVAVLKKRGRVVARALLWPTAQELKDFFGLSTFSFIDRVYATSKKEKAVLLGWAISQGYAFAVQQGEFFCPKKGSIISNPFLLVKLPSSLARVPYLDTLCCLVTDGKRHFLTSSCLRRELILFAEAIKLELPVGYGLCGSLDSKLNYKEFILKCKRCGKLFASKDERSLCEACEKANYTGKPCCCCGKPVGNPEVAVMEDQAGNELLFCSPSCVVSFLQSHKVGLSLVAYYEDSKKRCSFPYNYGRRDAWLAELAIVLSHPDIACYLDILKQPYHHRGRLTSLEIVFQKRKEDSASILPLNEEDIKDLLRLGFLSKPMPVLSEKGVLLGCSHEGKEVFFSLEDGSENVVLRLVCKTCEMSYEIRNGDHPTIKF